jgi:hypothetical protein
MQDERKYTTKEAADILGVDPARVRQIAIGLNGEIGRKWGRDWMFTEDDIERMRQRDTTRGPKPQGRREE